MTPEDCSRINSRISILEVKEMTHMTMLTEIKDTQKTIYTNLSAHMEKEESIRWKIAAALITGLFAIVAGLVAVVYNGAIS